MEYIKNNKGQIKTILVNTNEEKNLEKLEKLSLDTDTRIYIIPEHTEITLNEEGWLVSATGDTSNIWQFIKGWAMPYDCFVNGFPFPVNMEDMWKSDKEIENVSIEDLRWNLEFPWWSTDEKIPYNLAPNKVLKNINSYLEHKNRIENSDIQYPLLLIQTKQNRWLIYDGVHRFVKQIIEGKENVSCKKYIVNEMEEYIPDSHKELFKEWNNLIYQ